jgi:hypothetical protein
MDVFIILSLLHLSRSQLKIIFKNTSQPYLSIIVNGVGHGGIRMQTIGATNMCMISSSYLKNLVSATFRPS